MFVLRADGNNNKDYRGDYNMKDAYAGVLMRLSRFYCKFSRCSGICFASLKRTGRRTDRHANASKVLFQ